MGITVVGSLNYDLVTYTERIPVAGETYVAESFETHIGGKGLNQAISISKLKNSENNSWEVRMVGNVGSDSFGNQLKNALAAYGVNVSHVAQLEKVSTGVAVIIVEKITGQNRIMITAGANGKTKYSDADLEQIFGQTTKEYVVLQHEIPDPPAIMRWINANKPDFEIVFNPSPFHELKESDWKCIDILIVNEIEAMQIAISVYGDEGAKGFQSAIDQDFKTGYVQLGNHFHKNLIGTRHSAIVIITLGSLGCTFVSKTLPEGSYLPSIKVDNVLDTTAAGDTFLGAVVSQLYDGQELEDAIRFATSASSITITRNGAAETIPVYNEVRATL